MKEIHDIKDIPHCNINLVTGLSSVPTVTIGLALAYPLTHKRVMLKIPVGDQATINDIPTRLKYY